MVLPLGLSNRSGDLTSANIEIAQARMAARNSPTTMIAQIPSVKNPWQSYLDYQR